MIFSNQRKLTLARTVSASCLAGALVLLISISWDEGICRAQQPDTDMPGAQVLTRGPVHEAFAGMVTFNPEPGIVVTKAPPDIIEEVPPAERPEGGNVTWIPGYWAWDDERSDFLWVSGIWRDLPPGREWLAGYWGQTSQGYQWISGYWADTAAQETTYLPPPPATLEAGPNIAAPSVDYDWTPGCWVWYSGRYAWRAGYWAQGRADWNWIPDHYIWTPRGCIFVGGYWDYPVERRGVLFAPVYFEAGVYSRRGYYYSPTIVINLSVFTDDLFLRPRYHQYYFGDYYAASYTQGGFYASYSFQSSRYGYDPIYSHQRWEHRQDSHWEQRVEASYQYRRNNETARPPRTWAAQRTINANTAQSGQNRLLVALPFDQMAKRKDSPMKFQPVAMEERRQLARRGQEVQQSRDQRRTLEAKAAGTVAGQPGRVSQPVKMQLPRSPIVARPANQSGRNQAPPQAQRAPKPNLKFQPKSETSGRQPEAGRSNSQSQPRQPQSQMKSMAVPSEAMPREQRVQPESQPRAKGPAVNTPAASPRSMSGPEKNAQHASEPPARKRSVAVEKGATKLSKSNRQKESNGKPSPRDDPPRP